MASFSQTAATAPSGNGTVYFGFGSNLWLHQMAMRCPTSTYIGIARLPGYRWIINERGYANVVQVPVSGSASGHHEEVIIDGSDASVSDQVWGLVYRLQPEDERRLDVNEGVPHAYTKETLSTQFWASDLQFKAPFAGWDEQKIDIHHQSVRMDMLVYINREQTTSSKPKTEYIHRMNMGIQDACKAGVPQHYVDKVMRRYIPKDLSTGLERTPELALKQAAHFEEET